MSAKGLVAEEALVPLRPTKTYICVVLENSDGIRVDLDAEETIGTVTSCTLEQTLSRESQTAGVQKSDLTVHFRCNLNTQKTHKSKLTECHKLFWIT